MVTDSIPIAITRHSPARDPPSETVTGMPRQSEKTAHRVRLRCTTPISLHGIDGVVAVGMTGGCGSVAGRSLRSRAPPGGSETGRTANRNGSRVTSPGLAADSSNASSSTRKSRGDGAAGPVRDTAGRGRLRAASDCPSGQTHSTPTPTLTPAATAASRRTGRRTVFGRRTPPVSRFLLGSLPSSLGRFGSWESGVTWALGVAKLGN
jgi:hypothetical protein